MNKNRLSQWDEWAVQKYLQLEKSITCTKTFFCVSAFFLFLLGVLAEGFGRAICFSLIFADAIWCYCLVEKEKNEITKLESRHWEDKE